MKKASAKSFEIIPLEFLADSINSNASGKRTVWCAVTMFCTTKTGSTPIFFSSASIKSVLNSWIEHFLVFFETRKNWAANIERKIGLRVSAARELSPLIEIQMFPKFDHHFSWIKFEWSYKNGQEIFDNPPKSHFRVSAIEPISIPNFSSFPEFQEETHHDENHSWLTAFKFLMQVWQMRLVKGVNFRGF